MPLTETCDEPLLEALHLVNPYENFNPQGYRHDLEGWNSNRPVFKEFLEEIRPEFIIEVGTWKGASAIHMAKILGDLGIKAQILCIDTWLGSLDFWQEKQAKSRYQSLVLKNGYPTVYYQFLFNVIHNRLTENIIPFPQTARIAFQWLQWKKVKSRFIYIDASHEEIDVYQDISDYYEILQPGGVMFGDDYYEGSEGVRRAVHRFCEERKISFDTREDQFWVIRKP